MTRPIEYKDGEKAGAWVLEADKNRYRAVLGTLQAKTGVEPTTEVDDSKGKKEEKEKKDKTHSLMKPNYSRP